MRGPAIPSTTPALRLMVGLAFQEAATAMNQLNR